MKRGGGRKEKRKGYALTETLHVNICSVVMLLTLSRSFTTVMLVQYMDGTNPTATALPPTLEEKDLLSILPPSLSLSLPLTTLRCGLNLCCHPVEIVWTTGLRARSY